MDEDKKVAKFRPGKGVVCRIESVQPGGYAVKILPENIDGFLPARDRLKIGEVVPSTFVCMHQDRALMCFAYILGTSERVQYGLPTDEEAAFSVWADAHQRHFRSRRAIDLFAQPLDNRAPEKLDRDQSLEDWLKSMEDQEYTGCVRAVSDEQLSRAAMLLYEGRVVGCIYSQKPMTADPWPVEGASRRMIRDMQLPTTVIEYYELPPEIVLPMSSLFLGYPANTPDTSNPVQHLEFMLGWAQARAGTLCFWLQKAEAVILNYVHEGHYVGSFSIQDQEFFHDLSRIYAALEENNGNQLEVAILPDELRSNSVSFSFHLSSIKPPT